MRLALAKGGPRLHQQGDFVGTSGQPDERPIGAMLEAVGPLSDLGECNEGFLRDDAILVVTFITDTEDDVSGGSPAAWKEQLVAAKNGDEQAVIMLGISGGLAAEAGCDADPAPKLVEFAESFSQGQWASVCSLDYSPFFEDAVAVIDTACDAFEPVG